jgi:hypothetical protein
MPTNNGAIVEMGQKPSLLDRGVPRLLDPRAFRLRIPGRKIPSLSMMAVLVLAIIVRLLHARVVFYSPTADMIYYANVGERLFKGDPYWLVQSTFFPPGYPLWVWFLTQVLGIGLVKPVLYVQAVVGGLGAYPLMGAVRRFFNLRTALLAGVLYALYMPFVFSSALLMTESITFPLLALVLWSVAHLARTPSWKMVLCSGALLGAACYVRTNLLPLALPTLVLLWLVPLARSKRLLFSAAYIGALVSVLALWSIRNSRITGEPMFLASTTGLNFYQSNNPISDGGWPKFDQGTAFYRELRPKGNTPRAVEKEYMRAAREFIAQHPVYELFYLIPARLRLYFQPTRPTIWPWYMDSAGGVRDYPFGVHASLLLVDMPFVYMLALGGLLVRPRRHAWLLPLMWGVMLMPLIWVHGTVRFRYSADLFVLPLAGAAVERLMRVGGWRRPGAWLLAAYIAFCLVASLLLRVRFSGPNLLNAPGWFYRTSAEGENTRTGYLAITKPLYTDLFEVRTKPGYIPHLYLRYDYRVELQSDREYIGPNVKFSFTNDAGTPITLPVAGGSVLSGRHRLNRYQTTTGTAWHVIMVPAAATRVKLTLDNDVQGTVTIGRMELRGPLWTSFVSY